MIVQNKKQLQQIILKLELILLLKGNEMMLKQETRD